MQVTVLTVTAQEFDTEDNAKGAYTFEAYQYANGVCSVSYEHTHDGFFLDSDSIEACGLDEVIDIEESHTFEMSIDAFKLILQESINEFGHCGATKRAMELINA
jgi:hypothetical protein